MRWAAILVLLVAFPGRAADRETTRAFVEQQLRESGVPGAAVAVIRENRLAWSDGYGVVNSITRTPVDADTPFSVASNGKAVTAWLTVQAAARGTISLDIPVMAQAAVDLPAGADHRAITPRHLLTHTSGLGNFLRDRERRLASAPGERFSYSGVGFLLLQELLERKNGRSLDQIAGEELFAPLGMRRTWFGQRPAGVASIAPPHVELSRALAPFSIIAIPPLFALFATASLVQRFRSGRWAVPFPIAMGTVALAAALAFGFLWSRSGSLPLAAWFSGVPIAVAAAAFIFFRLLARFLATRVALLAASLILSAVLAAGWTRSLPVPAAGEEANAASSLRASAPDLARFMIELSQPSIGDGHATAAMGLPAEAIDARSAWGLGIGVERHADGRDLWHWGSNPGAKSLMIVCPETGDGVVVLTNGEKGSNLMRNVAGHVLGRAGCWRAGCD